MAEVNRTNNRYDIVANEDDDDRVCIPVSHWQEYTVDEALVSIGNGRVQQLLLIVLGSSCASYSFNIVLMSYLEPSVRCAWDLNKAQETLLSIVVFLGMMFGSSLWGAVASIYGRKQGTALSLAVEGVSGALASIAPNYWILLVLRSVVGIGLGGLASAFSICSGLWGQC